MRDRWRRPQRPLLDRDAERTAIDDLLELVRSGFNGVLVLRGGDGVGKTALLDYAVGAGSGFLVSAIAGLESEINLPYSALHELIIPFLPLIDDLPIPQRQALRVAFGLEAGPPPERFLVGLACLTLLSRAAADQPVLCAIDDAHLIDAESSLVIGFVARRLYADRIGIFLTETRAGEPSAFKQLPTIEVAGLPFDAAAALLRSTIATPLDPAVVDRVVTDTERNPLALTEIGSHLTARDLAVRSYLPQPIPVNRQLRERFLRQVHDLPADVQEFALMAAADATGDRSRIRDAATAAGIDADAAETAAEAADMINVSSTRVRFRHPLIQASVYHAASDASRRRAHHLLGQASADRGEADEQVWHGAAAAVGPDEHLAADLQAAANRARDRGAWPATAALLRRSVALTPDDRVRAGRQVALAKAELVIGLPETAQHIASDALPRLADDAAARGRAIVLMGNALFAQGRDAEAAQALADGSEALVADPAASADALMAALNAAIWAGPTEIKKIAAIPRPSADGAPRVSDLLLAGYQARFTDGYRAAAEPLRAAIAALRSDDLEQVTGLQWFQRGAVAAASLWDEAAMLDITGRWTRLTRKVGALTAAPAALAFRAMAFCLVGRLDHAAECWAEMRELMGASQAAGMFGVDSGAQGLLLAYRGEIVKARAAGLAQLRQSTARGQGAPAWMGRCILAMSELMAGHCEAAVDAALPVVDDDPVFTAETALPELIEAAVRSDQRQVAERAFAILADRASVAGTPWALGLRARCRALLDDSGDAEASYIEAIDQLGRSLAAVDLARAHLLYGQWLRRARRRRDARRQLRTAEDAFFAMGAAGFARQAGSELRTTGERARKRTPDTEFDLTPQEARVARLAVHGSTNNEIAEQLFISPSTVDYHLGKVFRKLGVRSRTQLANLLP